MSCPLLVDGTKEVTRANGRVTTKYFHLSCYLFSNKPCFLKAKGCNVYVVC